MSHNIWHHYNASNQKLKTFGESHWRKAEDLHAMMWHLADRFKPRPMAANALIHSTLSRADDGRRIHSDLYILTVEAKHFTT